MPKILRTHALIALCVFASGFAGALAYAGEAVRYEVKSTNGAVSEIRVHLTAQKKILVLDRFIDGESFLKREQEKLSTPASADEACAAYADAHACEQSCYWASKARPFSRVRMKNAQGQLLWQWQARVRDTRLALLSVPARATDSGAVTHDGCVSPDAKYLAVAGYMHDASGATSPAQSLAGYAIVKLAPGLKSTKISGKKTGEAFGHARFTRFVGWKKGEAHTVVFDIMRPEKNNIESIDEGVPGK